MFGMKIGGYFDMAAGRGCFLAGFQGIFQKVGKYQTHVNLVYRYFGRQIHLCLERNAGPVGQLAVITCYTVSCAVFTEMHVKAGNPAACQGKVLSDAFQIAVFCQGRQLKKMVADIVPCLTGFLNGGAEVIVTGLLERKKVIFLLP